MSGEGNAPSHVSLQRNIALQAEAYTAERGTQHGYLRVATEATKEWPGLVEHLPELTKRVEAILFFADLISSVGDVCSSRADKEGGSGSSKLQTPQEQFTLTDVVHGKNKAAPAVQWHPQRKAVLAVCYQDSSAVFKRKVPGMRPSDHALVFWNLKDVFQPEAALLVPFPLQSFHINPCSPHLVAGGCLNGRIAFWDLTAQQVRNAENSNGSVHMHNSLSHAESSHHGAVMDLKWLPGVAFAQKQLSSVAATHCTVVCSISVDGRLMLWDVSAAPPRKKNQREKDEEDTGLLPLLSVQLQSEGGLLTVTDFCVKIHDAGFELLLGGSHGRMAVVSHTQLEAAGASGSYPCETTRFAHLGCARRVAASNLLPDLVLAVAEWGFLVCKLEAGRLRAVFLSPFAAAAYMTGAWSLSRPGVVFVARRDGCLEIWDLLESSHQAVGVTPVAGVPLTCIAAGPAAGQQGGRGLLAIGDENGLLHLLDIPRKLRKEVVGEVAHLRAVFGEAV